MGCWCRYVGMWCGRVGRCVRWGCVCGGGWVEGWSGVCGVWMWDECVELGCIVGEVMYG